MEIVYWARTGYRKRSQACFYAVGIIREFKHTIRFQTADGGRLSVRRKDIISVEEEK